MKVRTKPDIDDRSIYCFDGQGFGLRPDTEYDAIGIVDTYFTVLDEQGLPALYPRNLFDILDDSDTLDWIWEGDNTKLTCASPRELVEQGFYYVDYYDKDPDALRIFEEFRAKLRRK